LLGTKYGPPSSSGVSLGAITEIELIRPFPAFDWG
jgi:hypothetical protein